MESVNGMVEINFAPETETSQLSNCSIHNHRFRSASGLPVVMYFAFDGTELVVVQRQRRSKALLEGSDGEPVEENGSGREVYIFTGVEASGLMV